MSKKQIKAAIQDAEACFDNTMSRKAIHKRLNALGWKRLGAGSFAIVLRHDKYPKVVIRIANRMSAHVNGYDGFQEYADLIIGDHVSGKYYPKVHMLRRGDGNLTSIAVVERLYRLKDRSFVSRARETSDEINCDCGDDHSGNLLKGRAKAVLKEISQWIPRCSIDIHGGNIMQRANGTPVFSDPVVILR